MEMHLTWMQVTVRVHQMPVPTINSVAVSEGRYFMSESYLVCAMGLLVRSMPHVNHLCFQFIILSLAR